MSIRKWVPLSIFICCGLLLLTIDATEGKKNGGKRKDENEELRNTFNTENNRNPQFPQGPDTETSAQAINPSLQNPLLYQNQLNQLGGVGGGYANLGGGLFSNQGGAANQLGGNLAAYSGGYGGYQNPYLGLNSGYGGLGNLGGLGGYGGLSGINGLGGLGYGGGDIYNQGAFQAQLYNNPLYGAGASSLTGAAAGINPLLLRSAQNQQYPVIGGLGNYNPFLAAQALLSPYSNYNQLSNYPFSSRFGIGAGTGRSGLGGINRFNSQNSNSRNNNDE